MHTNRFSKPVITAVIIVVAMLTASFAILSAPSVNTLDRSYDTVEQVRSERITVSNFTADRSYDQVETLRVNRTAGFETDLSYEQVEQVRVERLAKAASVDGSYDLIENLRAQRVN